MTKFLKSYQAKILQQPPEKIAPLPTFLQPPPARESLKSPTSPPLAQFEKYLARPLPNGGSAKHVDIPTTPQIISATFAKFEVERQRKCSN